LKLKIAPTINISSATITITIDDIEIVFGAQPAFNILENAANGTVLKTTITTSGDTPSSFSIIDGNTGDAFAIDANGNITVNNTNAIDYETATSFSLRVRVSDGGKNTDTQAKRDHPLY